MKNFKTILLALTIVFNMTTTSSAMKQKTTTQEKNKIKKSSESYEKQKSTKSSTYDDSTETKKLQKNSFPFAHCAFFESFNYNNTNNKKGK